MKAKNNLMADVVFEGGGVNKGIGLVGAIAVAEEKGYQWVNTREASLGWREDSALGQASSTLGDSVTTHAENQTTRVDKCFILLSMLG